MNGEEKTPAAVGLDPRLVLDRIDAWVDGFVRLIPNILVALVFFSSPGSWRGRLAL